MTGPDQNQQPSGDVRRTPDPEGRPVRASEPPTPCIICGRPVEPSRTATGWATCADCGRTP